MHLLKRFKVVLLIWSITILFCGCPAESLSPQGQHDSAATGETISQATLVVTKSFGKEILVERTIKIEPNTNAMNALQMIADVDTRYGGGFVSSINSVSSRYEGEKQNKADWFLYINGIASNVGAKDYVLQDGDIEHWDFRDWSYYQFIPAVIGDFPQPFLGGYRGKVKPTIIVYEERLKNCARSLATRLEELGIHEVSAVIYDQLSEGARGQCNLILLGKQDNKLVSELNSAHNKLGFYAYFHQGKLVVLDAEGKVTSEYGASTGLIQATQNLWNPKGTGASENVVWMISGTDADGVQEAVGALINHYEDLRYAYAAVISKGKIIRVP